MMHYCLVLLVVTLLSAFVSTRVHGTTVSSREAADWHTLSAVALLKIGRILHPSPASPAANKDWARKTANELKALGIWT